MSDQRYPEGFIPAPEQDCSRYKQAGYWQERNLGQWLSHWASQYGSNTALTDQQHRLSYQQLDHQASRLAAGLYQAGIRQGDKVLVQLPNCASFVILTFALFRIGAWPIMAMPAHREKDIVALCQQAEPVAYVLPDRFLGYDYHSLADQARASCSSLKHIIVDGETDTWLSLSDFDHEPLPAETLSQPQYTDVALLLLSGGTTGTPKLIPRTHADYAYNAIASAELCGLSEQSVYLAALPVGHNFPLACPGILGTLSAGGNVVMARTPGSDETFPLIESEKVTVTALVPPLAQLWLSAREWDDSDLSSLKLLQIGGSRLDPEVARQITPVLGCKLQQVFGMAEGLLCYTRLDDPEEVVINTQGRPLSSHDQVRVVNSAGHPVQAGETGELQTKGPYTIHGYYKADSHNATTFTADGFYQSGDLVRMTPEGNIVVEGRIKEQINRAGEKIAVAEVEQLLNEHPDIESCVLVPVPDERLGERSCAFIITSGAEFYLHHLQYYLSDKGLPRYKQPDQLEQVSHWPLTTVGKIDKQRLIRQALQSDAQQTAHPVSDKNVQPNQKSAAQTSAVSSASTSAPQLSDTEKNMTQYSEHHLKTSYPAIDIAMAVARNQLSEHYAIYEQPGEWSIGIGQYAQLQASKDAATLSCGPLSETYRQPRLCQAIARATQAIPAENWRLYGSARFELSHIFYDLEHMPADGTLLDLFVPEYEIRIRQDDVLLRAISEEKLDQLISLFHQAEDLCQSENKVLDAHQLNLSLQDYQQTEYKNNVQQAVDDIQARRYQKVILSRRIPLPEEVDLLASYRTGRSQNTPARSFFVNRGDNQLAGFSPETVVEVSADGWISTQPLAGTRALGNSADEEARLKAELLADTKEIAEHAASVKLAQEELEGICTRESIAVSEFMAVRRRGSVQHLASRVKGQLKEDKNAWDAFEALFPAVTASGIPKKPAIEAIYRYEQQPRGWYSGCVMIVDSTGAMDAALVLRSIYREDNNSWLQAGAGIVDQSRPERELEETIEKLSCIMQFLATRSATSPVQVEGAMAQNEACAEEEIA
ncbi:salicylate synthase [Oceanospirillum sediminis]|uniref:Salicylate synthase n=1 Tax=Oceanospirillum sediminis TaxID=2760088 RepID=A0A839IK99_9GAMM|nr:salicylate synthase [Oceanospirillum sediminis]MBB1485773.1 salicylate synthase [Oceanospirillum sediminis]